MRGEQEGQEEVLAGGNMTAVVRVGDTVRRAAGPWTPTIHALMHHLRAAGFEMVPEPLGLDDRGPGVISFLPGALATYPLPDFAWTDATLTAVAQTLRAFHDATLGFVPPPDGRWHAAAKLCELVAFIEDQAAAGDAAQQAVLARGDVLIYRRDIAHLEQLAAR